MKFETFEVRTITNKEKKISIVFPPKTGTRSIIEWGKQNGFKGDINADHRNNTVYCLYRPFRERIASAVVQWLASKGNKDLKTIQSQWHLVEQHWSKDLYKQNTHLIPLQGWVDPQLVDVPILTSNLQAEMNKLADHHNLGSFSSHQNKTQDLLLEYVNANITENMWHQLESDPVYRVELETCTRWLTSTH